MIKNVNNQVNQIKLYDRSFYFFRLGVINLGKQRFGQKLQFQWVLQKIIKQRSMMKTVKSTTVGTWYLRGFKWWRGGMYTETGGDKRVFQRASITSSKALKEEIFWHVSVTEKKNQSGFGLVNHAEMERNWGPRGKLYPTRSCLSHFGRLDIILIVIEGHWRF